MSLQDFLLAPVAFAPPAHVLEELSDADAVRALDGSPHSVAALVAHMAFWQGWFLDRCHGVASPMPAQARDGWPPAPAGSWNDTHRRFLDGLEQAASLASKAEGALGPLSPPLEFPPIAHYTMRDALTHIAIHNAHHLGQVVMLRQRLGTWPPPSGSWTW